LPHGGTSERRVSCIFSAAPVEGPMKNRRAERWSRREFLGGLVVAGTVAPAGVRPEEAAAEPPPETARIRLAQTPILCTAPQVVAEEFLRAEGFTDVQYVKTVGGAAGAKALASSEHDISLNFSGPLLIPLDAGEPIVILAGVHTGCFELFGTRRVRAISDLKGKTVAVRALGTGPHIFLAAMLAYVGLDPRRDVTWVERPAEEAMQLLAEDKIDGFLGFPPEPQEFRARKIGHVVVNSGLDRPWSQYFCCMVAANHDFVRKYPVATKRTIRAILKAADLCALEPERAAHSLVAKGVTERYDYSLQTMKDVPYDRWRVYNPEDTIRFYTLRLHEAGMIKSSPQKIIAQGTNWRFFNELRKELKS
jgi:NitT/TauT family transport system substrate-binding protein